MESPTLLVTGGLHPSSPKIDFFPAVLETGWPVLYPDEYDYRKGILERKVLMTSTPKKLLTHHTVIIGIAHSCTY
jgi:hypothetical protein